MLPDLQAALLLSLLTCLAGDLTACNIWSEPLISARRNSAPLVFSCCSCRSWCSSMETSLHEAHEHTHKDSSFSVFLAGVAHNRIDHSISQDHHTRGKGMEAVAVPDTELLWNLLQSCTRRKSTPKHAAAGMEQMASAELTAGAMLSAPNLPVMLKVTWSASAQQCRMLPQWATHGVALHTGGCAGKPGQPMG